MRRRLLAAEGWRGASTSSGIGHGAAVKGPGAAPRRATGLGAGFVRQRTPSSPSRPTRLCYGSRRPRPAAAPESPSKPSQAAAAAEAALELRAAALADRHRAMRKRAKKLRLRLANASGPVAWIRDEDVRSGAVPECDREVGCAPLPACVEAAKPRLVSLTSAVAKRKQDAMSVAHKEVAMALAEAGAAAAAGCGENSKAPPGAAAAAAALAAAVTGGLVRALAGLSPSPSPRQPPGRFRRVARGGGDVRIARRR